MSSTQLHATRDGGERLVIGLRQRLDPALALAVAALVSLGLVMVASASIGVADAQLGNPFHFLVRQVIYVIMGGIMAWGVYCTPLEVWERAGALALLGIFLLLVLVLLPGVGHTVNGATRWVSLGLFNLQVSE
ncbi:MAG: FtsW/RodA/SpoVE family cell cycle protein, partial [Ectothiorhodospira sp.]